MANDLLKRIAEGEILVADGAMGTLIFNMGLKAGDCPEKMNLDKPDKLVEIASLYRKAGADIIHTNTFGGSPLKLAHYDMAEDTERINFAAVQAARQGAGKDAIVSLSVGPSGQILKPYGTVEPESMLGNFILQVQAGIEAGADMITIETMIDIHEAEQAIAAVREVDANIPIMATMTFDLGRRGFFTTMGTDVLTASEELQEYGANIIGANCGNGSDIMVQLAEEFHKHTDLPLAIQANAGLPVLVEGVTNYPETPEFMAEHIQRYKDAGVAIIGGCCGTTPDHVKAIRAAVSAS